MALLTITCGLIFFKYDFTFIKVMHFLSFKSQIVPRSYNAKQWFLYQPVHSGI